MEQGVTLLIMAAVIWLLWRASVAAARQMSEHSGVFRGFLEKPDDADFARHFKNYFTWRHFGFRTSLYYLYLYDDERFYRYFRRQLFPTYRLLPIIMEVVAVGYLALLGLATFSRHAGLGSPGKPFIESLADAAGFLWFVLLPLVFIPVWKEVRRRYRLVDQMDRRFRRYREAAGEEPSQ